MKVVSEILGDVPAGYLQHVANTLEGGEAALGALLRLSPRPTAIVASTDVLAIGVLRGALLRGIHVPDELSVVGFDDIPMAKATVPGLTTLRMPMSAMAAEAITLAIGPSKDEPDETEGTTNDRPGRPANRVFPPSLIVRQSTAPPPANEALRPAEAAVEQRP